MEKKVKKDSSCRSFLVSAAVTGILAKPGFLGVPSGKLRGEEQNEPDLVVGLFFSFVEGEENDNVFSRNEWERASVLGGHGPRLFGLEVG